MASRSANMSVNVSKSIKAGEPVPEMEAMVTGGGFGFSVMKGELESTEYTLTTLLMDISYSTKPFSAAMKSVLRDAVIGLQKSDHVDFILLRVVLVNRELHEIHGFIPVGSIDPDSYADFICEGATAILDGLGSSVEATLIYGENLTDDDYTVNGCVYAVTDGLDNVSRKHTTASLAAMIQAAKDTKKIGSILTVLVGVNSNGIDPDTGRRIGEVLEELQQNVGMDQYVDVKNATPKELARVGGHIVRSVSSQSQRIKSGGASKPIPF